MQSRGSCEKLEKMLCEAPELLCAADLFLRFAQVGAFGMNSRTFLAVLSHNFRAFGMKHDNISSDIPLPL
jgi:hypothetical protein